MSYSLPSDADERPIAIDGAGTLGRRIASVYVAGGSDVRIFDLSEEQRHDACDYVGAQIERVRETLDLPGSRTGQVEPCSDLRDAVRGAWMVIEAVPEKVELKQVVFGQLDELAERDAILASNSSSIPTSQMISKVSHPQRVLNTQYQQPPELNSVELMSCGETDDGVIEALMDVVLNIEEHYAAIRSGLPEAPRQLLHRLIDEGRLGVKSGHGFYDYPHAGKPTNARDEKS